MLFATTALAATNSPAEVVIVVSANSSVANLSVSQIARIFLGKTGSFPNGIIAEPLDQAEGTGIRNEFYAKVTGKSPVQLNAYWSKIIFSGDGQPPRLVSGNEAVKKAVAADPNAIGYIDKSAVDNSVKILLEP